MNATDKIAKAAEYLHATLAAGEKHTVQDGVLRKQRRGAPMVERINGGPCVAGIVADGEYLPPIDGNRKGVVTLVAPRDDAEAAALAAAMCAAVADKRPMGSQYDPGMRAGWDAWRALRAELEATE